MTVPELREELYEMSHQAIEAANFSEDYEEMRTAVQILARNIRKVAYKLRNDDRDLTAIHDFPML